MKDTNDKIENLYFDMMMRKSPIERLKMGFSMLESARKIVISTIQDKTNIKKELFLRFYSEDFDDITKEKIIKKF